MYSREILHVSENTENAVQTRLMDSYREKVSKEIQGIYKIEGNSRNI